MKTSILSLLMLTALALAQLQALPILPKSPFELDGNDWKSWTLEEKLLFTQGFLTGNFLTTALAAANGLESAKRYAMIGANAVSLVSFLDEYYRLHSVQATIGFTIVKNWRH